MKGKGYKRDFGGIEKTAQRRIERDRKNKECYRRVPEEENQYMCDRSRDHEDSKKIKRERKRNCERVRALK